MTIKNPSRLFVLVISAFIFSSALKAQALLDDPRENTFTIDEQTAIIVEFQNRFRNSSLTVLSIKMVFGDSPNDLKPSHFGL